MALRNFFSCYHSQWLLFSPTKNNFFPHRKTEIYILKSFFVDSIYIKTIDIVRKKNIDFLFLNRGTMCKTGDMDIGAILQVTF